MKNLILMLVSLPIFSFAQTDTTTIQNSNNFVCILYVEVLPEFPGGDEAFVKYISKIKCSPDTLKHEIPRRTYVGFIVSETGKIKDVRILRSGDSNCDQEILRVISDMPDWKPGKFLDNSIPVEMHLPIKID